MASDETILHQDAVEEVIRGVVGEQRASSLGVSFNVYTDSHAPIDIGSGMNTLNPLLETVDDALPDWITFDEATGIPTVSVAGIYGIESYMILDGAPASAGESRIQSGGKMRSVYSYFSSASVNIDVVRFIEADAPIEVFAQCPDVSVTEVGFYLLKIV